jgi:thymidylate synthase ThyX
MINNEKPAGSANVYAVQGADPEVQAYAMAKYSRSALSMKDSLREINASKAEKFLNTFYFQYGHRSIADLAHLSFAIESLTLLAAMCVVDEQRWDGQERSTRFQDFTTADFYTPAFPVGEADQLFRHTVEQLYSQYAQVSAGMFAYYCQQVNKPIEMTTEAYQRALRARAFDVARYLLPLATKTCRLQTPLQFRLPRPMRTNQVVEASAWNQSLSF